MSQGRHGMPKQTDHFTDSLEKVCHRSVISLKVVEERTPYLMLNADACTENVVNLELSRLYT